MEKPTIVILSLGAVATAAILLWDLSPTTSEPAAVAKLELPEIESETYEVDDLPSPKWVVCHNITAGSYDVSWSEPYMWHGKSVGAAVACVICYDKDYAEHYARQLNQRGLGEEWSKDTPEADAVRAEIEATKPKD